MLEAELNQFVNDVLDRFRNPYLEHALMSISLIHLNLKRVLPSVIEFIKEKKRFLRLIFSLASLITFYSGKEVMSLLKDDQSVLDFQKIGWQLTLQN